MLRAAHVACKDEQYIHMGLSIAGFPFERSFDGFEHDAQPSLDTRQMHEFTASRWSVNGNSELFLGLLA